MRVSTRCSSRHSRARRASTRPHRGPVTRPMALRGVARRVVASVVSQTARATRGGAESAFARGVHGSLWTRKRSPEARASADARRANATGAAYLLALVSVVVGGTYASVPLYRMFCQATGFGGTTRRATLEEKLARDAWSDEAREAASRREVRVYFNADVAEGMPWRFHPTQKSVVVRPGESALAFYTARNLSRTPVTGVATYNVQPNKVGQYFNKVQCFCFEEQRLRGKEEVDMPVLFYIDPEFARDPNMRDVESLILSYTFFKSDDFEEDEESHSTPTGVRSHAPAAPTPTSPPA